MWIISQNNTVLTNGNIIFLASSLHYDEKSYYCIEFKNIDSEDSIKLAEYNSLEDCKIVLSLIKDAIKNSLFDFKLPSKEKLEKVKNDKKNK